MRPRIGIACSTMDAGEVRVVRRMQVPEPYVLRVEEAGGLAILLPVTDPDRVADYLELVDGLLMVGGDDVDPSLYGAARHPSLGAVDRRRDVFEIALARRAAEDDVPTFGVCRGLQVMNVALGGTLHQHLPADVPQALLHWGRYDESHTVAVVPGSRLAQAVHETTLTVNSHHHQAIERAAPGLRVSARSSDGVVEAAEAPDRRFLLGVQWHPERMDAAPSTKRLFESFVAAAVAAKQPA